VTNCRWQTVPQHTTRLAGHRESSVANFRPRIRGTE